MGAARSVLVAVTVATVVSGSAAAAPLADAGLDRTGTVGESVRLDATGSRTPDGATAGYEWAIEAPNGSVRRPACRTCASTSFVPMRLGRYNVTVTVRADDGTARSDTFHLTVEAGAGPSASLAGPTEPPVGPTITYNASLSPGNVPLIRVAWSVNGSDVDSHGVAGDADTVEYDHTFNDTTPRELTVTVTDVAGQRANDTVTVRPRRGGGGGGGGVVRDYMIINVADIQYTIDVPRGDIDDNPRPNQGRPNGEQITAMYTDTTGDAQTDFTTDDW